MLSGSLILCYGLTMIIPAGEVIVPGLFAAEKGGVLTGYEAWQFIQKQFMMHPRADVVGLGLKGKVIQCLLREIDFGIPVKTLVYSSPDSTIPSATLDALYVGAEASDPPELLTR